MKIHLHSKSKIFKYINAKTKEGGGGVRERERKNIEKRKNCMEMKLLFQKKKKLKKASKS